jgi:hypothetical protein
LLLPALESNASLVYRILFGLIGSMFMLLSSMALADAWRRDGDLVVAIGAFSCIPLWLIDWRVMSSPIRPKRLSFTPVVGVALFAIFPPSMWIMAGIAIAVQLGSKYDPVLSQRFGLTFPWFQHFLTALRSLSKPRRHVVPSAVQNAPSPTLNVPQMAVQQSNEAARRDVMPQDRVPAIKEWEFPAKLAASLHKIPVNQYSAVIADSLVKASGTLKRFVMNATCLAMIGISWLILFAAAIGVPQLIQNTVSKRELADIEYVFGHGDWTPIVMRVAQMVALLLAIPATALLLQMRFKSHRERAWQTVFAISLLAVSLLVLGESFKYGQVWIAFGNYFRGGEQGYAVNRLMDEVSSMGIFFGLLTAMVGVYFLLIGFRSQKPATVPSLPNSDLSRTSDDAGSPVKTDSLEVSESDMPLHARLPSAN